MVKELAVKARGAASKLLGEWFAQGVPHYVLRVE